MFDEIRNTILYYLKDIELPIVDGLEKKVDALASDNIDLIFESFENEQKTQLKAYLEEDFNMYNTKVYPNEIPILSDFASSELEVINRVTNYENNVISLENPILVDFYPNFTKIKISENSSEEPVKDNDYMQVNQNSFFTIKKNHNLTEKYVRYDILFYLKDDGKEIKSNHYSKKISEIFDDNKVIINESGEKTSKLIYIKEKVQSDVYINNVVDKILRCTMLIKYY